MSHLTTDALAAAGRRANAILPVLRRWVEQNSYSEHVEGVNAVGAMLREDFDFPGFTAEVRPGRGTGDHIVWRTPAWHGAAGRVVLVGHHDTVFPPGSFEAWDHRGDILRGPGVLDMKGGLATVWAALGALSDSGVLADTPLALVSVGDEEVGSAGSRPFLEEIAAGAGAALVFEAGRAGDKIVTRRKGTASIAARVTGRAAHAGNHHEDGTNAIWALARFVDAVQRLTDYDRGVTVNVGLVEGGEARNTVPAHASCGIDFRFVRSSDGRDTEAAIARAAEKTAAATGAAIDLDGGIRRFPLERTEASAALCARYAACAREAGLGCDEAGLFGGGSDANTVSAVGVPAIDGLGPRGEGFHTHDEYIEVSSLALRTDALVRFLTAATPE